MSIIGPKFDPQPVRNPLVVAASENLNMQINDLKEQINILISRLSYVSRSQLPCEKVNECAQKIKTSTPFSDTLDSYAEQVFAMKSEVRDALDRLEI